MLAGDRRLAAPARAGWRASQLPPIAGLAEYRPRLMQAIGIFFLGRVAIEIGRLLINRGMLGSERLDAVAGPPSYR